MGDSYRLAYRLVDDDVGAFCYDSFRETLYRALTEVVGVAFHSQSIDTYNDLFLRSGHRCLFVCAPFALIRKLSENVDFAGGR